MITVDRATPDDVDALIALESALFREDAGVHEPHADVTWPAREGRADLEQLMASDRCVVLVARDGDRRVGLLIGYATPSSPTRQPMEYAVLRTLYVAEAARRSGAATSLAEAFVAWARARGCAEAHVDHYAANEAAGRFYDTIGFTPRSISRVLPLDVTPAT